MDNETGMCSGKQIWIIEYVTIMFQYFRTAILKIFYCM